jgi:hypothetical protein
VEEEEQEEKEEEEKEREKGVYTPCGYRKKIT